MNSLRLLLQFAYKPNKERLCGEQNKSVYDLLNEKKFSQSQEQKIKKFIKKLSTVHAFTSSFGYALGKESYSISPVEAYIFGYENWDNLNKKVLPSLKKNLENVPLVEKKEKIKNLPYDVPLNHNFLVLYFGALFNPNIPTNIEFLDMCKVSLCKVLNDTKVVYNALKEGYILKQKKIKVDFPFFKPKQNEYVFLHHNVAFWKATPKLMKIYDENLKILLKSVQNDWR